MNEPNKALSDEGRARLRVIAEKLKGKELFPQAIARANASLESFGIQKENINAKVFAEDMQLFHEEVRIISQKISNFMHDERKILDDKIKDKENNAPK